MNLDLQNILLALDGATGETTGRYSARDPSGITSGISAGLSSGLQALIHIAHIVFHWPPAGIEKTFITSRSSS